MFGVQKSRPVLPLLETVAQLGHDVYLLALLKALASVEITVATCVIKASSKAAPINMG